jgi:hypothetical protein
MNNKSEVHSTLFIRDTNKVAVHYTAITSTITDPNENILRLHTSSGTVSHRRSSRQILLFQHVNQTTKTTLDADHNPRRNEASRP